MFRFGYVSARVDRFALFLSCVCELVLPVRGVAALLSQSIELHVKSSAGRCCCYRYFVVYLLVISSSSHHHRQCSHYCSLSLKRGEMDFSVWCKYKLSNRKHTVPNSLEPMLNKAQLGWVKLELSSNQYKWCIILSASDLTGSDTMIRLAFANNQVWVCVRAR